MRDPAVGFRLAGVGRTIHASGRHWLEAITQPHAYQHPAVTRAASTIAPVTAARSGSEMTYGGIA